MDFLDNANKICNIVDVFSTLATIEDYVTAINSQINKVLPYSSLACLTGNVLQTDTRTVLNINFPDLLLIRSVNANLIGQLETQRIQLKRASIICDVTNITPQANDPKKRLLADYKLLPPSINKNYSARSFLCFLWLVNRQGRRQDCELITLLSAHLRESLLRIIVNESPDSGGHSILSPRENEVLQWIAKGKTTEEIAIILNISYWTVKTHVKKLLNKLGAKKRNDAVAKAYECGLVDTQPSASFNTAQTISIDTALSRFAPISGAKTLNGQRRRLEKYE